MATQFVIASCEKKMLHNWRAYHVFYHGDRNVMLRELVWPLFCELEAQEVLDRFYFIRYDLGGPHLRLRWRLKDAGQEQVAEDLLGKRSCEFFRRHPSARSLSHEQVLRSNQGIAKTDPSGQGDVDRVFPNEWWQRFPTFFEIERYGGESLFSTSLDLFCISSLSVFRVLNRFGDGLRHQINSSMLGLMLELIWAWAGDEEELSLLGAYASRRCNEVFRPCIQEADILFERKAASLAAMVLAELEVIAQGEAGPAAGLFGMASLLAGRASELSPAVRYRIGSSHIHMTANRIGLTNAQEVYLSRIVARTMEQLIREAPKSWLDLEQRRSEAREAARRETAHALNSILRPATSPAFLEVASVSSDARETFSAQAR